MFCKLLKIRKTEWSFIVIITVLILVGTVIYNIIMAKSGYVVENPIIVALSTNVLISFIYAIANFRNVYNLQLTMNRTRKSFLASYSIIECIKYGLIIFGYYLIRVICYNLLSNKINVVQRNYMFKWDIILLFVIGIVSIQLCVSAFILRYGKKAYYTIWAIYMIMCFSGEKIASLIEKILIQKLQNLDDGLVIWYFHCQNINGLELDFL